ncbi:MAG: Crp/Fnr family transcriptional regulator [Bacteroidales bacterium]|nr:Crp/Fnr family transcriptional regulator [Bacteroidales bacterium]MDT8431750.1 Crp/Fnr family transcriptional regulator [Bacteroidales bacterium]
MRQEHLHILSQSAIFAGLPGPEIGTVLQGAHYQLRNYERGKVIAQSGTPCDHIRIVLEGKVAGEMMDLSGKILKIEDLYPSKMIAPAFLYGRRRNYPVNVVASEDTLIWQMHRDDFSKLLQKELRLLNNYLNAISNRAQFLSEKIRILSFPTLRAKLAFLFLRHAGDDKVFKLPMTHQQLSELFGVARPSVSREIRLMNNEGLIGADRDLITIRDPVRLRAMINNH